MGLKNMARAIYSVMKSLLMLPPSILDLWTSLNLMDLSNTRPVISLNIGGFTGLDNLQSIQI